MMRIPAFIIVPLLALPIAACAQDKPAKPGTSTAALLSGEQKPAAAQDEGGVTPVAEDYICPMHKNVHGKKGGVCPICGMPLVLAHTDNQNMTPAPEQEKDSSDE